MISSPRLALTFAVIAGVPAHAEPTPPQAVTLTEITLTGVAGDGTAPLDGLVATDSATATKTGRRLIETPASLSVVGAAEVARRGGASNLADALSYTAGVAPSPAFSITSDSDFMIRGSNAWGQNFLDGLKVGTGATRAGQPSIEPYGIERFEVLRGPASVLYGQVAPGGIVNTVSKRPLFDNSREGFLQFGSHGKVQTGMDVNGVNADGTLGWRIVTMAQRSGTQMDDVDDNRLYIAPSLTWKPTDATTLTLLAHWRGLRGAEWSNGSVRPAMEAVGFHFNPGEPGFDRRDSDQWGLGYELRHQFSPDLELVQNLRFRRMDGVYRQVFAWNGLTANPARPLEVGREAFDQDQTVDVFDVDTRLRWNVEAGSARHEVLIGLDHSNNRNRRTYSWGEASPLDFADPESTPRHYGNFGSRDFDNGWRRETAIYAQDTVAIGRWHLTGGLRWARTTDGEDATNTSWNFERDQQATVGNLGILYEAANGLSPYASFAQSFQPETGTDWQGKPFDPTTGEQVELGVKYQPGPDVLVTAAAFQITRQNILTTDPDHPDFSRQVGEVRVRGLELEGRIDRGDWDGTLAYTLLDAEITRDNSGNQGNTLSGVARHGLSGWLNWAPKDGPMAGIRLGGGLRYQSKNWGDDGNTVRNDEVVRLDLAAGYDFGVRNPRLQGVRLDLNLNNIGAKKGDLTCSKWSCDFVEQPSASLTLGYRF